MESQGRADLKVGSSLGNATATRAVFVKGTATVAEIDRKSRIGLARLRLPWAKDGQAAAIQIGPVLRGTALRDALEFVRFTDFVNQLEFAGVANALNDRVDQRRVGRSEHRRACRPRGHLRGRRAIKGSGRFYVERKKRPDPLRSRSCPCTCNSWGTRESHDTPVLEARGITKVFPGTTALGGVGIGLERGRVRALIGENGAGKSTLVSILAGVEQPTSGELLLDGVAHAVCVGP